jgi:hypothetical protein
VERATQSLGHSILNERRLANTRGAVDAEHISCTGGVRDPGTYELQNL